MGYPSQAPDQSKHRFVPLLRQYSPLNSGYILISCAPLHHPRRMVLQPALAKSRETRLLTHLQQHRTPPGMNDDQVFWLQAMKVKSPHGSLSLPHSFSFLTCLLPHVFIILVRSEEHTSELQSHSE